MTLLALLRHGQTDWSRARRIQGRTDTELNDAGCQWLARRRLPAEFGAWRSFSSPLRRCIQTCEYLRLVNTLVEPRIIETDWGQWEGRRLEDLRSEQGLAMAANEGRGFDFCPDGGESPRQVLVRVRPWLREIALAGERSLAVTHRGVIRVILADAFDWDMRGKAPVRLDWNALHLFNVDPDGRARPERLNIALDDRTEGLQS